MILDLKQADVITSGVTEQKSFRIEASAKAFKILSSQLYQNKIEAIIRELGANAADSHIAAGKPDVPFKVTLPSYLDLNFSIQDFGTGISPKDMEIVYTTYFMSTKTNSNDETGCFGLGSKTPFCYVDTFSITSVYEGVKYEYLASVAETGIPSLISIGESETDEQNGLKVSFAVQRSDIYDFQSTAKEVYKWFKVKPEGVTFNQEESPMYETEDFRVYPYGKQSGILMGNIFYETDIQSSYSVSVVVFAKIGEVDITVSRETVEMTKKTEKFIEEKKEKFYKYHTETIQKIINSKDNFYDALCYVYHNSLYAADFNYKGRKLDNNDGTFPKVKYFQKNSKKVQTSNFFVPHRTKTLTMIDITGIKGYRNRILEYMSKNNIGIAMFFNFKEGEDDKKAIVDFIGDEKLIIDGNTLPSVTQEKREIYKKVNFRECICLYNRKYHEGYIEIKEKPEDTKKVVYIIGNYTSSFWYELKRIKDSLPEKYSDSFVYYIIKDKFDTKKYKNFMSLEQLKEFIKEDNKEYTDYLCYSDCLGQIKTFGEYQKYLKKSDKELYDKITALSPKMLRSLSNFLNVEQKTPEMLDKVPMLDYLVREARFHTQMNEVIEIYLKEKLS